VLPYVPVVNFLVSGSKPEAFRKRNRKRERPEHRVFLEENGTDRPPELPIAKKIAIGKDSPVRSAAVHLPLGVSASLFLCGSVADQE
jgi:hypothetical protein